MYSVSLRRYAQKAHSHLSGTRVWQPQLKVPTSPPLKLSSTMRMGNIPRIITSTADITMVTVTIRNLTESKMAVMMREFQ